MPDPISGYIQTPATGGQPAEPAGHTDPAVSTPQASGQPEGQAGHVDDLFKGIDPQKLPPELRPHLDSMVRTYREKTEKLSETVKSEVTKATEAYRQKAEFYDQIAAQEEFVKQWNEHVQKASQPQTGQAQAPDPVQKKLQELEMKFQQAEAAEVISAFVEAVDEKGNKLHPDFDKFSNLKLGKHPQAGDYDLLRAAIELAPGKSPAEKIENGYKAAKATYDAIFEEGKKAGMGRVQTRAQNGTFSPSSVNAGSLAPRRAKDAVEALQFARQGLAVPKE